MRVAATMVSCKTRKQTKGLAQFGAYSCMWLQPTHLSVSDVLDCHLWIQFLQGMLQGLESAFEKHLEVHTLQLSCCGISSCLDRS